MDQGREGKRLKDGALDVSEINRRRQKGSKHLREHRAEAIRSFYDNTIQCNMLFNEKIGFSLMTTLLHIIPYIPLQLML